MSKFDKYRNTDSKQARSSKFDKYRIKSIEQEGDSWGSLVPKSIASGTLSIADLPQAAYGLGKAGANAVYNYFDPKGAVTRKAIDEMTPSLPMASDLIKSGIKNVTGVDLTPKPRTAGQRIASHAGEFVGGIGGGLPKRVIGLGKAALGAATVGGTAGALQEVGVNPLLADIGSSLVVPNIPSIAKSAAYPLKKGAVNLMGLGVRNPKSDIPNKSVLNTEVAKGAKNLGIELPTATLTESKLVDTLDQYLGKTPVYGDILKRKYDSVHSGVERELQKLYDAVGPVKSDAVRMQIKDKFDAANGLLPKNAETVPENTLNALNKLKNDYSRTIKPSKEQQKILDTVAHYEDYLAPHNIKNIPAPVEILDNSKRSLYKDIKYDKKEGLYDERMKEIPHAILEDLNKYGQTNPKWHSKYKEANDFYSKVAKRKKLEETLGKATNYATDTTSYNKLSALIYDPKTGEKLKELVGTEYQDKLQQLGEISRAMAKKTQRVPNPSGTAATSWLVGLAGSIAGGAFAPGTSIATAATGFGLTKLLADQKFVDLALKFAEDQAKGKSNFVTRIALDKQIKNITGYTPLMLSKEYHKIQNDKEKPKKSFNFPKIDKQKFIDGLHDFGDGSSMIFEPEEMKAMRLNQPMPDDAITKGYKEYQERRRKRNQ